MLHMKNVLLLGDSIRQNYQEYVKNELKDIANVYYTNDNGRFCAFTLRYLHEWFHVLSQHEKFSFDIIHFNCGLWDILRLSNDDEPFTSKEQYRILLKRVIKRIKTFYPNATIIFALTTEVIEPGFEPGVKIGQRRNKDIQEYNAIAMEVMKDNNIDVDDLWSVSKEIPIMGHSDDVHFDTEIGKKLLGEKVVSSIIKYCVGDK